MFTYPTSCTRKLIVRRVENACYGEPPTKDKLDILNAVHTGKH